MGSSTRSKPHAVCMPLPAQGHINAMIKLAKLLHFKGFHITFIYTESIYNRILASSSPDSLPCSTDFQFETIPDGMMAGDMVSFFESVRDDFADPFGELVKRLNEPSSGVPPVSCIISDSFTSFTLGVAAELGIPDVFFCSVSACSYLGMLQYDELIRRGLVPPESERDLSNSYLETSIDWIPGMIKSMRVKDLPNFLQQDKIFKYFKDEVQSALQATAIIMNTFDELEFPVLNRLSAIFPPIYTLGPLNLLYDHIPDKSLKNVRSSFWKEDHDCLKWLGDRMPQSVIYINFGSVAVFKNQQLIEFGWGIANSGHDFLWVIRPDIVDGDSAILPKGFLREIEGRGFLTSWCPQEEVLTHSSIGGFLTHCGWNSTMESMSFGVPVLCYPYFGDQQTNCRYLCDEWGIGLEIGDDVRREEVAEKIRELMGGEKGKDMRRNAAKLKENATKASEVGGSSFLNLERVIKEVLGKERSCI
ncbi:uncharacterized protein A4U43_C08F4390 [Asparagus officinalis]|uniref:7-deoxyloganetin glucosyltransferase-like n=1 Tax=Asparagus officinalis TaxID=4686 RepID=UPI00098E38AB|nr:7-deoxyloganetin glucosyltransferase-like [Asparagus officinalis]XP_020241431.1 7-deoxyloganetin glucosyltransferase-like [Asparagus officinalis]ONK59237.1 uncharacterized protein A4U43_C08F4390 [Asparagus officinalis]